MKKVFIIWLLILLWAPSLCVNGQNFVRKITSVIEVAYIVSGVNYMGLIVLYSNNAGDCNVRYGDRLVRLKARYEALDMYSSRVITYDSDYYNFIPDTYYFANQNSFVKSANQPNVPLRFQIVPEAYWSSKLKQYGFISISTD